MTKSIKYLYMWPSNKLEVIALDLSITSICYLLVIVKRYCKKLFSSVQLSQRFDSVKIMSTISFNEV